jgi:hypothetical protein
MATSTFLAQNVRAAEPAKDNVAPKGFRVLFNGKNLDGWKEGGKEPEHWTVKDGLLLFDGKGRDLFHVEKFSNYVLHVDWRVEKNGNSGVYLRGGNPVKRRTESIGPRLRRAVSP